MDSVGVFLCTGCEIGDAIDVDALEEAVDDANVSPACFSTHACLCSPEGLAFIDETVAAEGLDGYVVAACSPRVKTQEFLRDPRELAVERASLREQVAWTQPHGEEDTQMLAADLVRMGVARVAKMSLAGTLEEAVDRTVLVVGGGLAGLTAAKAAAALGHPVVIVESAAKLGGYLADVKDAVPEGPAYDALADNRIAELVAEIEGLDAVTVHLGATIKAIKGQPGQFAVELEGGGTFVVGAIVQATGARPYDASKLAQLGYGASPNVITSLDLDRMITKGELARPSDGKRPQRVLFVQCAGSRDADHLPYCSSECCLASLRQTMAIRRDFPGVECSVVYRDLRAPGQYEHFYLAAQEGGGALFTRGVVGSVSGNGNGPLAVKLSESLLGDDVTLEADLVVLATGMVPNAADGEAIRQLRDAHGRVEKNESPKQVEDAKALIETLAAHEGTDVLHLDYRQGPDMPALKYGFPDSHYICFPYETRRTGVYAAGVLRAPMDATQAAEDGWGAAMKAVQCIEANTRGEAVHPRAGDAAVADFSLQRCTQCKRCTEECPFGAINEDAKGTPEYNPLRCRRCGICLGACPERIINFPDYSVEAVTEMVKAFEVPEEDDEKPRVLAFMCENDALPALDEAAARRLQLSPWIRVIPVRCLGAVNRIWVADALARGIDGIMLLGCKHGDDYQCHYVKGSELAEKRIENLQDTLERLMLEAERVQVYQVARDEYAKIPEIFTAFAEAIEEMEPNPYKGF